MTGFIQSRIKNPTRSIRMVEKASATVTVPNYLLVETAGLAVDAAAGATTATIVGVCNQAIAAADALTQVPVIEVFPGDEWVVDSTNDSLLTDNGQLMVIGANAYTVNNTHTTNAAGVVKQVGVFGATGDRKIIVTFV
jgi:hypothetical protein